MKHGEVRIIAGKWRSRKLKFPLVEGLRPTTNVIRETAFNWLTPVIQGARCLDLFAGSGALGMEALSRGASYVTFVDANPLIVSTLQQQLSLFGANNAVVYRAKIPTLLPLAKMAPDGVPVDLVFLDPPFHRNWIADCTSWLEQQAWLAEDALIYIEAESKLAQLPIPAHWEVIREKSRGQAGYYLVKRNKSTIF